MRIGVVTPVERSRRAVVRPSIRGISTSSTMASGRYDSARSSAATPSAASSVSYPSKARVRRSASRTAGSSSTIRMRAGASPLSPGLMVSGTSLVNGGRTGRSGLSARSVRSVPTGVTDIGGAFFVSHLLSASHAAGAQGIWRAQLLSPPPWRYDRSDLTVLIGMAKPRPTLPAELVVEDESEAEYIAELIPMTWPLMLISAPPELPGLSEASVWIALYVVVEP